MTGLVVLDLVCPSGRPTAANRLIVNHISDQLVIRKCLIKFPQNQPTIVQFNQECWLLAVVRKPHDVTLEKNQPIYTHQIKEIIDVKPPTIDNIRIPFFLIIKTNNAFHIFFDLSIDENMPKDWPLGKDIAQVLQQSLEEDIIITTTKVEDLLNEIGLWIAPSLILYPINAIIDCLGKNDKDGAINILLQHCDFKFLDEMTQRWSESPVFKNRQTMIQESLWAHKQKKYTLVISTLVPQIEGIITDWLECQGSIPDTQKKKLEDFFNVFQQQIKSNSVSAIASSTLHFIHDLVFSSFKWTDDIPVTLPRRHVVGHGKYFDDMYTGKNSVVVFLLLDTIYYLISN